MGETASSWKLPLHSSDSEHPTMKRRESRGRGRNCPAVDHGTFPMHPAQATRSPVDEDDTNPFDRDSD